MVSRLTRLSSSMAERFWKKDDGMVPLKLFFCRRSFWRLDNCDIVAGRVPEIALPAQNILTSKDVSHAYLCCNAVAATAVPQAVQGHIGPGGPLGLGLEFQVAAHKQGLNSIFGLTTCIMRQASSLLDVFRLVTQQKLLPVLGGAT